MLCCQAWNNDIPIQGSSLFYARSIFPLSAVLSLLFESSVCFLFHGLSQTNLVFYSTALSFCFNLLSHISLSQFYYTLFDYLYVILYSYGSFSLHNRSHLPFSTIVCTFLFLLLKHNFIFYKFDNVSNIRHLLNSFRYGLICQ